ncbi:hypothetical protein GGH92_000037 [Coemansia sp. RSA 2673]|nr:hypothetical protein GGH92_000037 [Coemansia sp. RSA 2673]
MSYFPEDVRAFEETDPDTFEMLENYAMSKKTVVNKAIATVSTSDKTLKELKDALDKPFDFIFGLMDKYGVRDKVENSNMFWMWDIELMKFGILPEGYVTRIKDFFPEEGSEDEDEDEPLGYENIQEEEEEEEEEEDSEIVKRLREVFHLDIEDEATLERSQRLVKEARESGDESVPFYCRVIERHIGIYTSKKAQLQGVPSSPSGLVPDDPCYSSKDEGSRVKASQTPMSLPISPPLSPSDQPLSLPSNDIRLPSIGETISSPIDRTVLSEMRKEIEDLKRSKGLTSMTKMAVMEARLSRYEADVNSIEGCVSTMSDTRGKRNTATKYEKSRDQSYYRLVPRACQCSLCLEKVYPDEVIPGLLAEKDGDSRSTKLNKEIARDSYEVKLEKINKLQMHLLKKMHVDRWYDLSLNREVMDYCQCYDISSDDHMIIQEVKKRIAGIDYSPYIILDTNSFCREERHNNWFLPDVSKEMVKKQESRIAEARMGCSYLKSLDKFPARIEHIATKRINQQPWTDKRFDDMGWETRRKRLCYYYYLWFGFKSYHPQIFESPYALCLMRIARVMELGLNERLFSLKKDQEYMLEMRLDMYKMFMIKEKNWGQKDIVANYCNCAGAYLRQVYLECQILIKEFGNEAREKIPDCFRWIWLKSTKKGKARGNPTLNRAVIPKWVDGKMWAGKKAARNRDVPLEDIMSGKLDAEANKIWTDDPYFMDPSKLYQMHLEGHKNLDFNRRLIHWRASKVFDRSKEKRISFKEFEGDNVYDIGKDFPRFRTKFVRPKLRPSWKKPFKLSGGQLYDQARILMGYGKDEVRSLSELPELKIAYSDLSDELMFRTDFPVKEVTYEEYWNKIYIPEVGPRNHMEPIVMYRYRTTGGKLITRYHINKKNLKELMKTGEHKEIYAKVKWYFDLLSTYRKERNREKSVVYDDMVRMFDYSHLEEKYHLGGYNVKEVIFKEFDEAYKLKKRGVMECEYLDEVMLNIIKNMKMLYDSKRLNPIVVSECFDFYYFLARGMLNESGGRWSMKLKEKDRRVMDEMMEFRNASNDLARKKNRYEDEISNPTDVIVKRFIRGIREEPGLTVSEYPPRYIPNSGSGLFTLQLTEQL